MREHVKKHSSYHDVSERVCSFCSKLCTSIDVKRRHEREHIAPKGEFACETCGKVFKVKFKLDKHFKETHLTGNYPCNECNQVFKLKWQLNRHKASHRPPNEVPCEICGKLIIKRLYKRHLIHHGPPKFECSVEGCTKMYFGKFDLARHIENCHEESKNIKCPECASVYPNDGKLKQHMRRSHAVRNLFCEVEGCNYKQSCKEYLKLHLRTHKEIDARLRDEMIKKLTGRSKKKKTGNA